MTSLRPNTVAQATRRRAARPVVQQAKSRLYQATMPLFVSPGNETALDTSHLTLLFPFFFFFLLLCFSYQSIPLQISDSFDLDGTRCGAVSFFCLVFLVLVRSLFVSHALFKSALPTRRFLRLSLAALLLLASPLLQSMFYLYLLCLPLCAAGLPNCQPINLPIYHPERNKMPCLFLLPTCVHTIHPLPCCN